MLVLGRTEEKNAELLLDRVGGVLRLLANVALKAFVSNRMLPERTKNKKIKDGVILNRDVQGQKMHKNPKSAADVT